MSEKQTVIIYDFVGSRPRRLHVHQRPCLLLSALVNREMEPFTTVFAPPSNLQFSAQFRTCHNSTLLGSVRCRNRMASLPPHSDLFCSLPSVRKVPDSDVRSPSLSSHVSQRKRGPHVPGNRATTSTVQN